MAALQKMTLAKRPDAFVSWRRVHACSHLFAWVGFVKHHISGWIRYDYIDFNDDDSHIIHVKANALCACVSTAAGAIFGPLRAFSQALASAAKPMISGSTSACHAESPPNHRVIDTFFVH